jgi:hypothetical protein
MTKEIWTMAGKPASPPSSSALPNLTQTDRVLLDLLRDGVAERSAIRNERAGSRAPKPEDTKRARLERNQERLEALFNEASARPAINRAFRDASVDTEELRAKADRAAWRDIATAVNIIRSPAERQADERRREAIAEVARAIVEKRGGGAQETGAAWMDVLEEQVRASFTGQDMRDAVVAKRLVDWTEAALGLVPGPVAARARLALVEHAYGEADGAERWPLRDALREVFSEDKTGRYARPSPDAEFADGRAQRPREVNRIWLDEGEVTPQGERQVREFVDAAQPAERSAEPGLIPRLRGYFAGKQPETGTGIDQDVLGEDDGIPESLRRRYAVHVSDDRRTIELFEAGAKTAAITLDAKSISTSHNEGAVIADIILLARDRGWQSLKVAGTAEFKDAVWLEARKAGLVAQHEPSSAVKAALEKWERERPANQIQQAPAPSSDASPRDELARAFAAKSPEQRLADPRFRNAQLELMIGIRTAEKELARPIAEMPEVAKALTAAVREQLANGKVFDAPFVRPSMPKAVPRQAPKPRIEADRITSPRP